jgi:hypothetical protein
MFVRGPARPRKPALWLEALEAREVPAILIQLDYAYDSGYFAARPDARAVLDRVASELGSSLTANLAAITPSGADAWTATFYNPSGSGEISIANLAVGANAIRVYVGARPSAGPEAGEGGPGGYRITGSQAWADALLTRGHTGYAPWGGSLSFDSTMNWWFGQNTAGLTGDKADFYTAAMHEMAHLLGIGTAPQWASAVRGSTFVGGLRRPGAALPRPRALGRRGHGRRAGDGPGPHPAARRAGELVRGRRRRAP